MKAAWFAAVCTAACSSSSESTETPQVLQFKRWSVPQAGAYDIPLATRGDVVVLAKRISRDGGLTWRSLDDRIGELKGVVLTGQTMTLYGSSVGLARYDLGSDTMTPLSSAPSYMGERTWRVDPNGQLLVFDPVENRLSVETSAGWSEAKLPQPTATEVRPYIKDVESNGIAILAVSGWGVHRSLDGGKTFTLVLDTNKPRDLLVLPDRRFLLVGDGDAIMFDATGNAAGLVRGLRLGENEATVCDDGAIIAHNLVTRDLGRTWHTLTAGGDLRTMQVMRTGCGGGQYWALLLSDIWGYRLARYPSLDKPGVASGNWDVDADQAWTTGGPPIVLLPGGTFLVSGFALEPTMSEWTLLETPSRTWAAGDLVFGLQDNRFFRSLDRGRTWSGVTAAGLSIADPEAFGFTYDGRMYMSEYSGTTEGNTSTWRSAVWKSVTGGASWQLAYEGIATRGADDKIVGEAHRFVGVTDRGAWIATDAFSIDEGITWQASDVKGDAGLAHLTYASSLVTGYADERLWRVYDDGGMGDLLATYQIEVEGEAIPASALRSVAFDPEGYAYIARGTPYVQIWRSDRPLD